MSGYHRPSLGRRVALWRLRWALKIGPTVSDETIARGLDHFSWRMQAVGADMADVLSALGPSAAKAIILGAAAGPKVPTTWWDE